MAVIDGIAAIHSDACEKLHGAIATQDVDVFNVADFVQDLVPGRHAFRREVFVDLNRLSRKLEVARKIYALYCRGDFKPHPTMLPADSATLNALLAGYLEAYRQTENLRYLNTVYKTVLVGLIVPADSETDSRIIPTAEELLWSVAERA